MLLTLFLAFFRELCVKGMVKYSVCVCVCLTMYQSDYERAIEASQVWPSSSHQAVGNAVLPSCPFKETLPSTKMAGSFPWAL